ncbi:hypothetical protein NIES2135_05150 [Leptolyngbya boryana NIES-2135]|jgi:tetratricopeptide (TPR) repeat protein|uniref:Uncharacterized protein n=1 Tax=Leptolyngbya boryana NIES-2135 TaxID=1973484 RepID=A0A1Z4JA96_LEPBY|nr:MULTISPECIES: tetratricopeptide repeat protein [Leptolyngbya]BAY53705.1 hypothetical protein NIES2135_05150 [Leptolyngbya boryana NIES-2135]MBD2367854.1 tetratricopeptide repeat protein [Leptolyngbya sp. FACHB-161]MBD2374298.1 tetratricopeptide repeat protein [Leptolyngbya sp. FACHB-238]MBD2398520.1 tetratricopeptide repeat protein [Leptolyngbya sp. FACHB-239]MBD2406222.1 tetratricopeptide repeat protein [Leptolyngbya sp. FACHB-402]
MKIAAIGLAGLGIVCAGVWAVALVVKNNSPVATSVVPSPVPTTQATGSGGGSAFDETSKETCGDPPDASATWYAVFIDGGNLNEVHRRFCKDAIAVNRQDSGKASIQVASFSDRARAEAFAKSVSGEVSRYEPKVAGRESTVGTTSEPGSKMRQAIESYASRNYERSLKLFQEIIEEDPSNAQVWRNLGEAYHATGDDYNASLAMNKSKEIYLQNGDKNGAYQVETQLESWKSKRV